MIRYKIADGLWQEYTHTKRGEIISEIQRRRHANKPFYVHIHIQCDGVDLVLGTPNCPPGEGSRRLTKCEQEIVKKWVFDPTHPDFDVHQLIELLNSLG